VTTTPLAQSGSLHDCWGVPWPARGRAADPLYDRSGMSIRYVIELFGVWTVTGIAGGAVIGAASGPMHMAGVADVVIMVAIAGVVYGCAGGALFAPVFAWLSTRLPTATSVRCPVSLVLGALCGVLGMTGVNAAGFTIHHGVAFGMIAGSITGLLCVCIHGRDRTRHEEVA
jgi:hypothetical protein